MAATTGRHFIRPKPAKVQLLEKQLLSTDPDVRNSGLNSIPKLQAPAEPLTETLADLLTHQNWYVRRNASNALANCVEAPGTAELSIKAAGEHMPHEDAETRRCAADVLVSVVQKDVSAEGAAQSPAVQAAVQAAARLANTDDPEVRKNAIEALTRMGEHAAPHASQIAACIEDPELPVRNAALRAFSKLGVAIRGGAMQAGKCLAHRDEAVRRCAARSLVALAPAAGKDVALAVARQVTDQNPITRRAALLCMADLGSLGAPHGSIMAKLLEDEDVSVRVAAVQALINAGDDVAPSLDDIMLRLSNPNPDIKRAAVDTMRGLSRVCKAAADAAAAVLSEDPTNLGADGERRTMQAFQILAGAEQNAEPYLLDAAKGLESLSWGERRAAIEMLEDLGPHAAKAAPEVARRLLHESPYTRRAAAEAIGRMGRHSGSYASFVENSLDTEEDQEVRAACEAAVERLFKVGALAPSPPVSPSDSPTRKNASRKKNTTGKR